MHVSTKNEIEDVNRITGSFVWTVDGGVDNTSFRGAYGKSETTKSLVPLLSFFASFRGWRGMVIHRDILVFEKIPEIEHNVQRLLFIHKHTI